MADTPTSSTPSFDAVLHEFCNKDPNVVLGNYVRKLLLPTEIPDERPVRQNPA